VPLQKNFTFHSLSLVKPVKLIPLSLFPLHLRVKPFPLFSIVKLNRSLFSVLNCSQFSIKNPFPPFSILHSQSKTLFTILLSSLFFLLELVLLLLPVELTWTLTTFFSPFLTLLNASFTNPEIQLRRWLVSSQRRTMTATMKVDPLLFFPIYFISSYHLCSLSFFIFNFVFFRFLKV